MGEALYIFRLLEVSFLLNFFPTGYPRKVFPHEIENFNAPADPNAYLRDLYRDYMTIPPESKRKIHAVYLHPDLKQDIPDTSAE